MITTLFLYVCLLAYMGLFAILYDGYLTLLLLIALLVLPVLLFFHLAYLQSRVRVRMRERMGVIGKEEEIKIIVEVENRSIFPVADVLIKFGYQNAFSDEKRTETISFSVPGKLFFKDKHGKNAAVLEKTLVLSSKYCGNILVTCEQVKIFDYLHLTWFRKRPGRRSKTIENPQVLVSVLPSLQEADISESKMAVKEDIFSMENSHFSKTKPGDDPSEIFDIREYREGDRIHRIHWKLSSKRNQWMVKDFSLPLSCRTAVLLDLFKEDKEEDNCEFMDRKLSEALSISYTLLNQGIIHEFVWVDGKDAALYENRLEKEEDFFDMIEKLLYSRPYGEENRDLFWDSYNELHEEDDISGYFYVGDAMEM